MPAIKAMGNLKCWFKLFVLFVMKQPTMTAFFTLFPTMWPSTHDFLFHDKPSNTITLCCGRWSSNIVVVLSVSSLRCDPCVIAFHQKTTCGWKSLLSWHKFTSDLRRRNVAVVIVKVWNASILNLTMVLLYVNFQGTWLSVLKKYVALLLGGSWNACDDVAHRNFLEKRLGSIIQILQVGPVFLKIACVLVQKIQRFNFHHQMRVSNQWKSDVSDEIRKTHLNSGLSWRFQPSNKSGQKENHVHFQFTALKTNTFLLSTIFWKDRWVKGVTISHMLWNKLKQRCELSPHTTPFSLLCCDLAAHNNMDSQRTNSR